MTRQLQVGLLAAAALAALSVAGLRIAHAARSSPPAPQIPLFGSTPSAEAAILSSLRAPPGFRRFEPCTEGRCFILRRSLPLDTATVREVAEAFGITLASSHAVGSPVECRVIGPRHVCQGEGIVRGEYVSVWMDQPEVRNPRRRTARNRRTYQRFMVIPGTEVEVSVLGHCLHPAQCEREKQQEKAEGSRL
jgi:hypothetical protein